MNRSDARWLDWSLPALAWVAGSLDAVSYLALGRVFTANMSGNTVLLGIALGSGGVTRVLRALLAVCGFALGAATGVAALSGQPPGWSARVNRVLLLEAILFGLLLLGFAWFGAKNLPTSWTYGLIAVSGAMMGMQSAAVRQVHLEGMWTTFVTGTIVEWIAWLIDRRAPRRRTGGSIQVAVYGSYGAAALVTAWLRQRWPVAAVVLAWLVLLGVWAGGMRRMRQPPECQSA